MLVAALLLLLLLAAAGPATSAIGPMLVVVAHPGDEALHTRAAAVRGSAVRTTPLSVRRTSPKQVATVRHPPGSV